MNDAFIGEIRMFGFGKVPNGWLLCDGQRLSIADNSVLYGVIGDHYGGENGTFALPDLQGRVAVHPSESIKLGQTGGEEGHALQVAELPAHSHAAFGGPDASSTSPAAGAWGTSSIPSYGLKADGEMGGESLWETGKGLPHDNMQPYNVLQFCICVEGIVPNRKG